jgi:hypothetical protein
MRPVYVCAIAAVCCVAALAGNFPMDVAPSHTTLPDVTVILDIKGPFSPAALGEMRQEAARIIGVSGIQLDWRMRAEVYGRDFRDLVVMTFRGSCTMDAPLDYDETGPYAFTRVADGVVQPFGEVDCDHVAASVRNALSGAEHARSDLLIGRALGRVVAHELVHMLTKSGEHARDGVQKSSLSSRQLIGDSLMLSAGDISRLRTRLQDRIRSPANPDTGRPEASESR